MSAVFVGVWVWGWGGGGATREARPWFCTSRDSIVLLSLLEGCRTPYFSVNFLGIPLSNSANLQLVVRQRQQGLLHRRKHGGNEIVQPRVERVLYGR